MRLDTFEQAREAPAPLVSDKRDMMAPFEKLGAQRMGRDHMAAGAAGGEDEVALDDHRPLHFTT